MKKSEFNILLFLGLYFLLKEGFYGYVGLTTPGGKLSSVFLTRYANFPYWFTVVVTKCSKFLLEVCGYAVYQLDAANVTIKGARGVTLAWGCLGIGALSLWMAFIIAHRTTIKYKLRWIIIGVVLIFIVNILRIDMIALSNYYHWQYFQHFNAHTSFDLLTYLVILIMMLVFVLNYNKKKVRIDNA